MVAKPPAPATDAGADQTLVMAPDRLALRRGDTGALEACGEDGVWQPVAVYRAFPLSDPGHFVVLCRAGGAVLGMVVDPNALAPAERELLDQELALRYHAPHVTAVRRVHEDVSEGGHWTPALVWDVDTDRGPLRLYLPNLTEHVRVLGGRRLLLLDRDGRRAEITDVRALDAASRERIRRHLGDQ